MKGRSLKNKVSHYVDFARFDYVDLPPLDQYVKAVDRVKAICKKHNSFFETMFTNHKTAITGGCPECKKIEIARTLGGGNTRMENIILMFPDYDLSDYNKSMFIVKCHVCGVEAKANKKNILRRKPASPCKKCNLARRGKSQYLSFEAYKHKVKDNGFDIRVVGDWVGISKSVVEINCGQKDHGWVKQRASDHLYKGYGCKHCSKGQHTSKGELEVVSFIKSFGVEVKQQDTSILNGFELDIYIPDLKLAIEYNGLYFHSVEKGKDKNYHKTKTDNCAKQGIRLIHIWEDDWVDKKDQVKEIIKNALGFSEKNIYARKCDVAKIESSVGREFLNKHHIQGGAGSSVFIGLTYEDDLVAVAGFKKRNDTDYELVRYSAKNVIGGFGKCLKFFERNYEYSKLITFCDLSTFTGAMYEKLGFDQDKLLPPDYKYVVNNKRVHKFNFRKKHIKAKYPEIYSDLKTESEMMQELSIHKIYDCGKVRYVKDRP